VNPGLPRRGNWERTVSHAIYLHGSLTCQRYVTDTEKPAPRPVPQCGRPLCRDEVVRKISPSTATAYPANVRICQPLSTGQRATAPTMTGSPPSRSRSCSG